MVPPVSYYQGMLPCADCAGILTELTLRSDPASGGPGDYTRRETWLATRDGDRSAEHGGRWSAQREGDATVYQLAGEDSQLPDSFLLAADRTLRLLDPQLQPLPPNLPQTLQPATELPVSLILADAGRALTVPVGQRLVLRLALKAGTGYRWAAVGGAGAALAQEGEPNTVPAPAAAATLGAGGWQVWRFQAVRPGRQTLRFEYRRPWEQRPPAQVAEFTIDAVPRD
jgi:copper homeostasis protein (lipoprotein)